MLNNDFDVERPGFRLFEDNFETIARALGREERAEPVLREYRERAAELRERYADVIEGTTVSFASFYADELRIDGPQGVAGALLADVGFEFPPAQLREIQKQDGWRASLSPERMRLLDADIIVNPVGDAAEQRQALQRNKRLPLFDRLSAVRAERFFTVDQELWFARSVLGAVEVLDDLERRILEPLADGGA